MRRPRWRLLSIALFCALLGLLLPEPTAGQDELRASKALPYRPGYLRLRDYRPTDPRLKVFVADDTEPVLELESRRFDGLLDLAYDPETRELYVTGLRAGRTVVRRMGPGHRTVEWTLPERLMAQSQLFRLNGVVRLVAEDVWTGTSFWFSYWLLRREIELHEVSFPTWPRRRDASTRPIGTDLEGQLEYDAFVGGKEVAARRAILKRLSFGDEAGRLSGAENVSHRSLLALAGGRDSPAYEVRPVTVVPPPSVERTPMCVQYLDWRKLFDFSPTAAVVVNTDPFGEITAWLRTTAGEYRYSYVRQTMLRAQEGDEIDLKFDPALVTVAASETGIAVELRPGDDPEEGPQVFWLSLASPEGRVLHRQRGVLARRLESWSPSGSPPRPLDPAGDRKGTGAADRTSESLDEYPRPHWTGFSPSGRQVLTADSNGLVRLWDVESGAETGRCAGHVWDVVSAALSPGGGRIVTTGADKTARVWDLKSRREIRRLVHPSHVRRAVFSPDGRHVLTSDGNPRLWDAGDGKEVRVFGDPRCDANFVVFSRDTRQIIAGEGRGKLRIWERSSGRQLRILPIPRDPVVGVLLPAGEMLTGHLDGTLRIWDLRTGAALRVLQAHEGGLRSIALSPDGKQVLTASSDGTACLWDLASAREVHRWHDSGVIIDGKRYTWGEVRSAAFSPDGKSVVAAMESGAVRVWDTTGFQKAAFRIGKTLFLPTGP